MVVTIKKPFSSKLKKKSTENLNSKSRLNIDLAPFSSEHKSFRVLPSLTSSHYKTDLRQQILLPPPLLEYILFLSRLRQELRSQSVRE